MKILYSKKQRKLDLFQGLFWVLFGLLGIFLSKKNSTLFYLYIPIGFIYLYLSIKLKYYLSIKNNMIKQHYIFGKKMDLSEIKSIKHFAGEYILKTDTRKMTINTSWVDQSSLIDLKDELKKLEVQWI